MSDDLPLSSPRREKKDLHAREPVQSRQSATPLKDRIGSSNAGPQENRHLFAAAMANPSTRRIAFNVLERNCHDRFKDGEAGIALYLDLFAVVESSGAQEAAQEFENRFFPMLDQELLKRKLQPR
jgi:hypothetical protein